MLAPAYVGPLALEPSLRGVPRVEEFLRVIVANPEDDGPRLVLSDFLSDHGLEERAELIRMQCRLHRLEEDGRETGAEYARLERRCDNLLEQWAAAWKPDRVLANCLFHRGLLETYRAEDVAGFLEIAPQVQEQTTLQVLRIRDRSDLHGLLVLPGLDLLYELDLQGACIQDDELRLLAGRSWLPGIRKLNLDFDFLGPRGLWDLAHSPRVSGLRVLSLRDAVLDDVDVGGLATAPWFPGLQRLDLDNHRLSLEGVGELVASIPRSLAWLGLGGNYLGDDLAGVLAQAPSLSGLKTLLLRKCRLGPQGAGTLARAPALAGLRRLGLSNNHVGEEGTRALLESPPWSHLAEIDLDSNFLGDEGACVLADSPGSTRFLGLDLDSNSIGDRGAEALARSPHLSRLTCLLLNHNQITGVGARALAASPGLGSLQLLSLENNRTRPGDRAMLYSSLASRSIEVRL